MNDRLKEWLDKLGDLRDRDKRGELSQEEKEQMEYMQDKYDDWASDGEDSY
jgi:hypothetical protein